MTQEKDISRRRFIAMALVAAATPMATALAAPQSSATNAPAKKPATTAKAKPTAPAKAPALPKLPLTDPQAKALAYTEDATKVKHAAYKPGSDCANCMLYKGAPKDAYGPCTLFPKHSVAAKGWCAGWVKKA